MDSKIELMMALDGINSVYTDSTLSHLVIRSGRGRFVAVPTLNNQKCDFDYFVGSINVVKRYLKVTNVFHPVAP